MIKTKIRWSDNAKSLIEEAPTFVQKMIINSVEEEAKKRDISLITSEIVEEIRKNSSMGTKKHKTKKIEDFFVKIFDDVNKNHFKNKVAIHAGSSGESISTDIVWDKIESCDEITKRRALYIHIPFCISRCKFCSFYQSNTKSIELNDYPSSLLKELRMVANSKTGQSKPIHAVYFGGGTPTDLRAEDLGMLVSFIRENFPLTNDCEVTIEGRIHGFDNKKVEACINNGVNRFSFGVQSFNTKIRQQMGRIESKEVILSRLKEIASYGKALISIDLIYGLPDQDKEIWQEDIEIASQSEAIDSVSVYSLKYLIGSPIKSLVESKKLSPPATTEEQLKLYRQTCEYFSSITSKRLGLRHWAFNNRERSMYNFIPKYNQSCIPIGNGAGGTVAGYRLFQRMTNSEYFDFIDKGLKPVAIANRVTNYSIMEGEITGSLEEFRRVNFKVLEKRFNDKTLIERLDPLFSQWVQGGMVSWSSETGVLKLTEAGEYHNVPLVQNIIDYNLWSIKKRGNMSITDDKIKKIHSIIRDNPSKMTSSIAEELQIPEGDVVKYLPDNMSIFVEPDKFEEIWETMTTWEKVTSIVTNSGIIAEMSGKLSRGKKSHGYFNLFDKDAPLNGHIKSDSISSIYLVSKPFMKLESHSIQFFDQTGEKILSIYLGRNSKREIIPNVLESYQVLRNSFL